MGLPLILIGGRLGRARFIGRSDELVGGHNETSWRRTSSLFSGESSLIASTISSTVDMAVLVVIVTFQGTDRKCFSIRSIVEVDSARPR